MIKKLFFVSAVMALYAFPALAVPGAGEVGRGNAAYFKGDFKEAAEQYEAAQVKAPNDPRIDYDLGAAAFGLLGQVGFVPRRIGTHMSGRQNVVTV